MAEKGFFPDVSLSPSTILDWVRKQNGIFNGRSDTPASRSLNYFTRLFVHNLRNDELSDLVWAVAGIEALLVDSGRSSIGQLKTKLSALFKNHPNLNWLMDSCESMYNFRSKMIHGNRQIRSSFRDDDDDDIKRFDEEYNSVQFAVGLLLILIRRLIKLGDTRFRFETVLLEK